MTKPASPQTVAFIEDVEESNVAKLTAYWDGYRAWTIGFGHTGPEVVRGYTITRPMADILLGEDLQKAANNVDALVRVPLNDNQRLVLISFDFNEGDGALAGSTLLRRLNRGDYAGVVQELPRWVYAADSTGKMRYSAGLATRRTREAAMWNLPAPQATPSASDPPAVSLPPIQPTIPDAAPFDGPVAHDPDAVPSPQPPLTQSSTIMSTVGAFAASGGASVLAFIQSPYALVALGMVLVFGYVIIRERQKARKIGGT